MINLAVEGQTNNKVQDGHRFKGNLIIHTIAIVVVANTMFLGSRNLLE
jgi:hypothetical protein